MTFPCNSSLFYGIVYAFREMALIWICKKHCVVNIVTYISKINTDSTKLLEKDFCHPYVQIKEWKNEIVRQMTFPLGLFVSYKLPKWMLSSILNSALVSHYELALSLDLDHLICPHNNRQFCIHPSVTTYTPTSPINFRLPQLVFSVSCFTNESHESYNNIL